MRVLQINSVANSGSTGRIAEELGNVLIANGHESYIAYGRGVSTSSSTLIKIGAKKDVYAHGIYTLLTDKHGFASVNATNRFINQIDNISPDVVVINNLHGYYINLPILFDWINKNEIPVVWTLFDCWAFTGHCSYFDDIDCEKWKTHCSNCPKSANYPRSLVDNSYLNYEQKREIFTSVKRMELVAHSQWLGDLVRESFMSKYPLNVTPSAINIQLFKPRKTDFSNEYNLKDKKILLGCASTWSNRKGYEDFIKLSALLSSEYKIVMLGLSQKERRVLPPSILGLKRTESADELAQWYSLAHVFINPTSQDNFPTTNLEALACGTPVITYNTGGSPEAIDENTGFVVEKGNISGILDALDKLNKMNNSEVGLACRTRAEKFYNINKRFLDYLKIIERLNLAQ